MIDRIAQNTLGQAYGQYNIILTLALVFNIVLDIGIQNFNNKQVAGDHSFFKANFKSLIGAKIILSFIYFTLIIGVGYYRDLDLRLLMLIGFNQILTSFILYLRSNISGLQKYTIDSLFSVSDKTFAMIICIAFFYSDMVSIHYFVLAQTIGLSITLVIIGSLNIRYSNALPKSVSNSNLITLIRQSLPYALLFALMGLYTRADVLMMDFLLPKDVAVFNSGIYAQSFRLLDAACMFAMLFSGLLLPMFSRLLAEKKDIKPLTELSVQLLLIIAVVVSMTAFFFNDKIMFTLYRFNDIEELNLSSHVLQNIMLCFIPMCIVYTFGTLLTAKGDIKAMNLFAFISLVLNIVLNLILIPKYESAGASVSSLTTQTVFALLCTIRCFQLFGFKIKPVTFGKFVALIVCLVGLSFFVKGIESLWLILGIFLPGALVLVLLLQFFDFRKMFAILMKEEQ